MPKVDYRRYTDEQRDYCRTLLLTTLQDAGVSADGLHFLGGLLMESEIVMCARRIEIARRLLKGWSFERIMKHLHVGLITIVTVDRWLTGNLPGYRTTESAAHPLARLLLRGDTDD